MRIPKPFTYGQVFGSLPERFFEYLDKRDPTAFEGLVKTMIDASTPVQGDPASVILPTGIKPLIENATNWQFFRERPVVGEKEKRFLPYMQYGKYTGETSKAIGRAINYSPAKIENLVQGYFGGTGMYGLQVSDLLAGAGKPKRPRELADYPLAKGFVTRPAEAQPESLNKFYRNAGDLSEAYQSYRNAIKTKNRDEARYIRNKYPNLMISPRVEGYRQDISEVNKEIDKIISSNLPEETKRQKIRFAETRRLNFAKRANQLMERGH